VDVQLEEIDGHDEVVLVRTAPGGAGEREDRP
jgi:hypothetical protein